jgi:hypothetical protein
MAKAFAYIDVRGHVGGRPETRPCAKEALLAADPAVYFTIPHFDGYPAVLARLDLLSESDLEEFVTEGWLVRAPKRLVAQFLNRSGRAA